MKEVFEILAAAAQTRVRKLAEEGAKRAALVLAGAFLLVAGFVALMVAAYFVLATMISREAAAAIIGGGFIIVGMIVLGLAMRQSRKGGGARRQQSSIEEEAQITAKVLEREAAKLFSGHAKTAVVIALLAGMAVGASKDLRKALARELEKRSRR